MSVSSCRIQKKDLPGVFHGGAWKVAYADFVTAMMAFFLLLWLLNVTTQEQKNAISNYFDPTVAKVSQSESGAGGVLGGLSMSPQGAMATTKQTISQPTRQKPRGAKHDKRAKKDSDKKQEAVNKAKEALKRAEEQKFSKTAQQIKQAIAQDPDLAALSKNILIDMTPEGLRIQVVDEQGQSMFARGSSRMFENTEKLMKKMAGVIQDNTTNALSIRGHTDSIPYGKGAGYTNWELSSDRANASRRVMLQDGFPPERINNVMGKADTEPLIPDDPANARNRRITVILLREELTNPDFNNKVNKIAEENELASDSTPETYEEAADVPAVPAVPVPSTQAEPAKPFQFTPGQVEFP